MKLIVKKRPLRSKEVILDGVIHDMTNDNAFWLLMDNFKETVTQGGLKSGDKVKVTLNKT